MPAGRKINGFAGHGSKKHPCLFCCITKDELNNFDWRQWKPRDAAVLREAAFRWRDAPNDAERTRIYNEHGVRWSELWRLRYFDPIKMVIVDGMHAIFEGLIQFHSRQVLGIDDPEKDERPPTSEELASARKILTSNPTAKKLRSHRLPVLRRLCDELNGDSATIASSGQRLKKTDLVEALLTRNVSSQSIISMDTPLKPFAHIATQVQPVKSDATRIR
jgi:hypothetical protein